MYTAVQFRFQTVNSSIKITWQPPTDIGGIPIFSYNVLLQTINGSQTSQNLFTVPLQNAVQQIVVSASAADLHGHFYVINNGETSEAISVDTNAEDMKAILERMFTISSVDVETYDLGMHYGVQDTPLNVFGRIWIVKFHDDHTQSLLVSTSGDNGITAAGGTLYGTNAFVTVDNYHNTNIPQILPSSFLINSLSSSMSYSATVQASNGFLSTQVAAKIAVSPKVTTPGPVQRAATATVSDKEIRVTWQLPSLNGGSIITGYNVEWDVTNTFSSRQRFLSAIATARFASVCPTIKRSSSATISRGVNALIYPSFQQ